MDINIFDKSIKTKISLLIRTIRKYKLIEQNETIAVALSGGKDSVTMLWLLWYINKYSYLNYNIIALHVKTSSYDTTLMEDFCSKLGVNFKLLEIDLTRAKRDNKICYSCARFKRQAMWKEMDSLGIKKIAYGHHADDLVDTYLMNLMIHSKIESFPPKLDYRQLNLTVIRPLIFIRENWIKRQFTKRNLPKLSYVCPHEKLNVRDDFREKSLALENLYANYSVKDNITKALEEHFSYLFRDKIDMEIKIFK